MLLPVCRKTGIEYSALLPLQKQFGLSSLVGGMLTANNSLALAANQNRVACACDTQGRVLLGLFDFYITGLLFNFRGAASPKLYIHSFKTNQHSIWSHVMWCNESVGCFAVWPFWKSFLYTFHNPASGRELPRKAVLHHTHVHLNHVHVYHSCSLCMACVTSDCIAHAAEGTKPLDRWTKEGATALLFWD